MNRDVIVRLRGGLGNQLFQWAAGFSLSRRLGGELLLDASEIGANRERIDQRFFELSYFGIEAHHPRRTVPRLRWLRNESVFREKSFAFDPAFANISEGCELRGYFQSWRYFADDAELLVSILRNGYQLGGRAEDVLRGLRGQEWTAVHVRRGDYKNFPEKFLLLGRTYFDKAIKQVQQGKPGPVIVFAEDSEEVSELVPNAALVVDSSVVNRPGDVMMMMSLSTALVGSNSTLSWWAGLTHLSGGSRVVFPQRWFSEGVGDTRDLLPPQWSSISDEGGG